MYKPLIVGGMNTFYMYVFPVQFFLGVIGNALNLCVLLSRHMRSEVSGSTGGNVLGITGFT